MEGHPVYCCMSGQSAPEAFEEDLSCRQHMQVQQSLITFNVAMHNAIHHAQVLHKREMNVTLSHCYIASFLGAAQQHMLKAGSKNAMEACLLC